MSQINPFVPAIASTPQAQRLAAADRDAQVRRTAQKLRTSGYAIEREDEYVESAEAVQPANEREQEHPQQHQRDKKHSSASSAPSSSEDKPHIDLQA